MKTFQQFTLDEEMNFNNPVFVRYGGLSSVPQDGYVAEPTSFHQPPASKGIYAFVKGFVEPFLLGKKDFDPRRQEFVRDGKGKVVTSEHPDYHDDRYEMNGSVELKNGLDALIKDKKPVTFKYNGPIWSHLEDRLKPHEIERRKGSWVLSDMSSYVDALKREVGAYKSHRERTGFSYTIDHLEVFIEKV